jgi:hypothetical protein
MPCGLDDRRPLKNEPPKEITIMRSEAFAIGPAAHWKVVVGIIAVFIALMMAKRIYGDDPNAEKSDESPAGTIMPLMQLKLEKSKAILEGLTLEDFDRISRNAKSLKLLSMESGWNVIQTPEYETQSRDFRRAADMIAEAAAEKDISRATLGYVALTTRCVECHSYMRKHRTQAVAPKTR